MLRNTPVRYILDDTVAAFAAQTAFAQSARLPECLDLLRMPAPCIWVEWSEKGRHAVMSQLGLGGDAELSASRSRAGLLIRSDVTGRRGDIDIVWSDEAEEVFLAPFTMSFDLDNPTLPDSAGDGSVCRKIFIAGSEALSQFCRHVRFHLRPQWQGYYQKACANVQAMEDALAANIAMIAADFPFLSAFCLILGAKNALTLVPSELDRLNKARAKKGKVELLDHIEVSAAIDGYTAKSGNGDSSSRSQARLHFVCGHLVRRERQVFWRRPHMRGNATRGIIVARNVRLRRIGAHEGVQSPSA